MAGRGPRAGGDRRMPGMPDGTRVTGEAWARDPWDAGWGAQGLRDSSGQWDPSQFHDDDQGCHAGRPRTGEWPDGEASVRQGATRERRGGERPDGDGIGARHRDAALVRIHDPAGRPRGLGFVADHHGTVVTSHEVVDGMPRLVLHTAEGDRRCVVPASAVTPLPALDLALVRTEGLGVDPLPVTVRDRIETGAYVRIAAGGWREARVLGATSVTYTATDRCHLLDDALELAIGTAGRDALRLGGGAAGGPVLDAGTGAVVGVLGTALRCGRRDAVFAVPLGPRPDGPLAELLAENAATVPAYGVDLNLAGVLELTATSVGQDGPPGAPAGHGGRADAGGVGGAAPVERASTAREFSAFAESRASVLGLVGRPGSGRTTELAALAARRDRGPEAAPTLWLRGADLKGDDTSVADAARRALTRAARIVAVSAGSDPAALGDTTPERLARLARTTGRPLLLLLDGPEEMPPVLAHRLTEWTEGTEEWLRVAGARLVVACRAEYWEGAGAEFPEEVLYGSADRAAHGTSGRFPPCVRLGDLTPDEAHQARARYGIPDDALAAPDARHPLTLRLLSEVRAALPDTPHPPLDRDDVLSAHLDLMCLRIAVRLAAENGLRGTAVRRLAAKVSGQVHEAARRSLGPGQGELDRTSFEAVFPWGPAPARLGGGTGWASAVLTEGLLVPAGDGYRFAHEELADWIQGMHLDLDEALHALVHRRRAEPDAAHPLPVPHHRIGPVVQALLLLTRHQGVHQLALRLEELTQALDADRHSWWAARLLAETLLRVPDAMPYQDVLRLVTDRIVAWSRQHRSAPPELGPAFWTALPLPDAERLDLLRRLVLADGPQTDAAAPHRPRYLDAVAHLLAAAPTAVQSHLTRWFDDDRPLPATPHATVACAAQALLYAHRDRALDDLTENLVDSAHRRADELLAVLAEEEPSAMCRAVDRWAHDDRPARRVAAVVYGPRAAPHARTEADRELLRHAALALLDRPADCTLHGGALAMLVRDPSTRSRHLPQALRHFAEGDPQLPPSALVTALTTHPEPVLDAFRARLHRADGAEALRTLADVTTPDLARRVATLVGEAVERHPETAEDVAAYVDRRLDHDPACRAVLFPLVTGLLDAGPEEVRAALAAVLAASGAPASRALRRELLDFLLDHERSPAVLDAFLHATVRHSGDRGDGRLRDLVHHTGVLLVRTPDGAARFDRGLVDLGRYVPGFAVRIAGWLNDTPQEWATVVGPSTRRMIENLAGVRVPA
ncbi:trypsin-like peptidase domain-containing protein [Streptomyces sp. T12]|uniref:trypsin-like peptidase domain-containing protein n=3 Tax=unclassified Streptomyces TaxID=2593676 RepID=UPI002366017A|nr:trypsin-like peptidase domain-containing protein [Streptomyces sp. T12]WDF41683.1 trypsin-like peptidase domain-containing protein [Streptomyces sp. T12]